MVAGYFHNRGKSSLFCDHRHRLETELSGGSRKGPGRPALPLRVVQIEAQRAEKILFGDRPPPPPPPPLLRVAQIGAQRAEKIFFGGPPPPPPVILGLDPALKLTKTVICFQFHPSHHLVSLHVLSGAGCRKGLFVHPPD